MKRSVIKEICNKMIERQHKHCDLNSCPMNEYQKGFIAALKELKKYIKKEKV